MATRRRARCGEADQPERRVRPRPPAPNPLPSYNFRRQTRSDTGRFSSEPQRRLRPTLSLTPSSSVLPPPYMRRGPRIGSNVARLSLEQQQRLREGRSSSPRSPQLTLPPPPGSPQLRLPPPPPSPQLRLPPPPPSPQLPLPLPPPSPQLPLPPPPPSPQLPLPPPPPSLEDSPYDSIILSASSGDVDDDVSTSFSVFDDDLSFLSSPSLATSSSSYYYSSDYNDTGDHGDSEDFNSFYYRRDGDSRYSSPGLNERLVMNFVDKSNVDDVMSNFDCTVCLDTMFPPVYQCCNGHAVCGICKPQLNECPSCRSQTGFFRCLPFEKLAASFRFHCRYRELGCLETFPYGTLEHEMNCKFELYNCPFPISECTVSGGIPVIVDHMISFHKCEGCTRPISFVLHNIKQYTNSTCWKPRVYKYMDHYFLLYIMAVKEKETFYLAFLMYVGEDSIAKSFRYTLKIKNNRRKILYQGVPRSIRDGYQTIRDSCDGLVINRSSNPLLAMDGNGPLDLVITGKISRSKYGRI